MGQPRLADPRNCVFPTGESAKENLSIFSEEDRMSIFSVIDILENLWGQESNPPVLSHEDPMDGLILTLLSQNTNDRNRDRAFSSLKKEFPAWKDVLHASQDAIAKSIKVGGLAKVKSERIKSITESVMLRFGEPSLRQMGSFNKDQIVSFLQGLPGVGPKTIACMLVFEFQIPAFPVDTHVHRFCVRMKWVPEKTSSHSIQQIMENVLPRERMLGAHLNIITHGRKLCYARNPKCKECPLSVICPFSVYHNCSSS